MRRITDSHAHLLLPLLVALLLLTPSRGFALEKASIVLQWLPQAQFAGYYVAKDKGFYEEAGIDLQLISGGPDVLASEYLETGEAEFATLFLSTGIQRRSTLPIVNIGQFVQHSALMLVAMKNRGIERIEDLGSKKVGLWANEFQVQARALFKQKGIKVIIVPQTDSLELFMRNGVAAASGMFYNEYHTLLSYGVEESEMKPFLFRDYGLDFPEDGIYTLEKTANSKPELCEALTAATSRGWMYAFNHPDEALDIILSHMKAENVPANRAHQLWMLKRMEEIILADDHTMGVLRQADYDQVKDALIDAGLVKEAPIFPEFYRGPIR